MPRVESLNVRQLEALVVTAEELHFGRAASRLYISQPGLSQQIGRLEQILGVDLFERSGRHVALTQAGARFVEDARRILRDVAVAVASAQRAATTKNELLHVCYSRTVARLLFPALLQTFPPGPGLGEVSWIQRPAELVGADLEAGRYDIAVGRYASPGPALRSEVLHWEKPVVFTSRTDPLSTLTEISPSALSGRRVRISRRELAPQRFDAIVRDLKAGGLADELDATLSYAHWEWSTSHLAEDVATGSYVVIEAPSAIPVHNNIVAVPLAPPVSPIPVTVTWRQNDERPSVTSFIDALRLTLPPCSLPASERRAPSCKSPEARGTSSRP
jgi:DNA-binding transcriptional LysR family regulator